MLTRPKDSDFAPFQKKYIDLVPDNVLPFLTEQKDSFVSFIESLTDEQLLHKYADDKWTIKEVLVHILDTELIFNYRTLAILRGDQQKLNGFDQDLYIKNSNFDHLSKEYLINNFNITRYSSLILYKGFSDENWNLVGNMSDYSMKLNAMPFMIGGHLMHHLNILKERYLS